MKSDILILSTLFGFSMISACASNNTQNPSQNASQNKGLIENYAKKIKKHFVIHSRREHMAELAAIEAYERDQRAQNKHKKGALKSKKETPTKTPES